MRKLFGYLMLCIVLVTSLLGIGVDVHAEPTEDYKTFSQIDPRWGSYVYASTSKQNYTIAGYGCYIVSYACLMAYANPELRDVNTFNPKILAQGMQFVGGGANQSSTTNVDPTWKWESFIYTSGGQDAVTKIKNCLDDGKYVIVLAGPPIASKTTHFSPIVGWNDETQKPIIMDVCAGRNPTWEEWEPYVTRLDVCSSTTLSSTEAFAGATGDVQDNAPKTDEERQELEDRLSEMELEGMGDMDLSLALEQGEVPFMGRDGLSVSEVKTIEGIGTSIIDNRTTLPEWFNRVLFFIGMLILFYAVVLFVAMLFDYNNVFIEFSLVSILTLGRCNLVDSDYVRERTEKKKFKVLKKRNLTRFNFVIRLLVMIGVSIFIMSGAAQYIIILIVREVTDFVVGALG